MADYEDDFEDHSMSEHPSELSLDFFEETIESVLFPPRLPLWQGSLVSLAQQAYGSLSLVVVLLLLLFLPVTEGAEAAPLRDVPLT